MVSRRAGFRAGWRFRSLSGQLHTRGRPVRALAAGRRATPAARRAESRSQVWIFCGAAAGTLVDRPVRALAASRRRRALLPAGGRLGPEGAHPRRSRVTGKAPAMPCRVTRLVLVWIMGPRSFDVKGDSYLAWIRTNLFLPWART